MNLVGLEWIAWRVFVVGAGAAMFLRLQCAAKPIEVPTFPASSEETAFGYLVTPDELAVHKAKLLATVGEKSTRCARPVLRGEPAPGPALPDQLAFDATGPLSSCVVDWRNTLERSTDPTQKQVDLIARCAGPLEAAVTAAIGHAEGCSAYGLGGPEPSEIGAPLFASQLLDQRARELGKTDAPTALWMLLDLIRFGQDYARGRTELMLALIGTAIESMAVEHAHEILDRGKPANVDELAKALDVLLASEPSFGETAASDTLRLALDQGLAGLEPATWIPPGGKRSRQSPPIDQGEPAIYPAMYSWAVKLVVFGNLFPIKLAQACPADASLAACLRGLERPSAPIPSDGSPRSIVLQALVEAAIPTVLFVMRDYVIKRAQNHGDLIALRLHVEVLRRGCDRAALATLATTSTLGDAVRLDYAADVLAVRPPAWASSEQVRRFACK